MISISNYRLENGHRPRLRRSTVRKGSAFPLFIGIKRGYASAMLSRRSLSNNWSLLTGKAKPYRTVRRQRQSSSAEYDMNWGKLFHLLAVVSRFGLGALFLFTAGAKLWILRVFAVNVSELLTASGIDYSRWMWPVTIAVIAVEIVTAILLLLPRTVRVGAIFAALLLAGFACYALYYVYVLHGEPLECGCFGGIIASQLGVKTAVRNLALIVPAIIVFFGYRRSRDLSGTGATEVNYADDVPSTIKS
ncbi:MAG: hypothetical protein H7Z16_09685 [Pyrinomonadaceae bacterium]|nr:hypothetical protein [Pyrinomonadaceae bacterium]